MVGKVGPFVRQDTASNPPNPWYCPLEYEYDQLYQGHRVAEALNPATVLAPLVLFGRAESLGLHA